MAASSPLSFFPSPPNPSLPVATTTQSQVQPLFSLSSFSLLFPAPQSPMLPLSLQHSSTPPLEPSRSSRPTDPLPVMCPSLTLANLVFCKDAFNVQVEEDPDEPEDAAIIRFEREVSRAGIIREAYRRRFYENKREERIRKRKEAAMRKRPPPPREPEEEEGTSSWEGDDEDDDNWNFVDAELPYC